MEWTSYFEPLSLYELEFSTESDENNRIGNFLQIHTEENGFPTIEGIRVAILGIPEERFAYNNVGCSAGSNEIRKQFYTLFCPENLPPTADLGNFRIGKEVEDTYLALSEVLYELLELGIVPIILGGSQDLSYANYLAYEKRQEIINITAVDARFDIGYKPSNYLSNAFFHKIILRQPNYLFNYSNLGYQSYFVSRQDVALMEKLHFDTYRLGMIQEDILRCEPILRDSTIVNIDMSALRFADSPGCRQATPNGLNGKEICAISRFAGAANRVTSFGIYEYNPHCDTAQQSAILIAEMLWYFLDGFSLRNHDQPDLFSENYVKYIVEIHDHLYHIHFYKNKVSGLWWMEVPCSDKKAKYERMYLIPCSEEDYETACRNELPERWLSTYQKLEKK